MDRPFAKYEGLGNDFVLVMDGAWGGAESDPSVVQRACDRHRGIGADGVIVVSRASDGWRMVIRNADGSRPEMCGNGARCVAAWLVDRGDVRCDETVSLATDAGPRPFVVHDLAAQEPPAERQVSVAMGVVRVSALSRVTVQDASVPFVPADAGNPHAVVLGAVAPSQWMDAVAAVGARTDLFPAGVNVEFVQKEADGGVRVRVHERGVGWTQACGTGACAVAAVLQAAGEVADGAETPVRFEAGTLVIQTRAEGAGAWRVTLRGPARRVFQGAW